jgi:hypothetical protein
MSECHPEQPARDLLFALYEKQIPRRSAPRDDMRSFPQGYRRQNDETANRSLSVRFRSSRLWVQISLKQLTEEVTDGATRTSRFADLYSLSGLLCGPLRPLRLSVFKFFNRRGRKRTAEDVLRGVLPWRGPE